MSYAKLSEVDAVADNGNFVERRRHKRFKVEDGGVALLTPPGPRSTIVGHIIDISMTGLSFRYVADDVRLGPSCALTIALAEHEFYLRNLPIETVSDFEIARVPFGSMSPRRHSLRFGELSEEQTSHLEHFITEYSTCDA